jgi:hypothetical protein
MDGGCKTHEKMRNVYRILAIGVDGRIVLKRTLKK